MQKVIMTQVCNLIPSQFMNYNKDNKLVKIHEVKNEENDTLFTHIKYVKTLLDLGEEPEEYYKHYRCVILNTEGKVVGFGIPKSSDYENFKNSNDVQDCILEEFVEGTAIQLFYDKTQKKMFDKKLNTLIPESEQENNIGWTISTRGSIGAKNSFYKTENVFDTKNFASMFVECAQEVELDLSKLNKNICYNFVIKHKENRIVNVIKNNELYFISGYNIQYDEKTKHYTINEMDDDETLNIKQFEKIKYPVKFDSIDQACDWEDFEAMFGFKRESIFNINLSTETVIMGFVIKNVKTNEHTKLKNCTFDTIRELRGNQPKLEYHYLELRKNKKVKEFLHLFPEYNSAFSSYNTKVVDYTKNLYKNYVDAYITHDKDKEDISYENKLHLDAIHYIYRTELRGNNKYVQLNDVIQYVNNLPPQKLMYSLNYKKRKLTKDLN